MIERPMCCGGYPKQPAPGEPWPKCYCASTSGSVADECEACEAAGCRFSRLPDELNPDPS